MPLTAPQLTVSKDKSRFKVLISGRRFGKTHLGIRTLCESAAKNPGSINWAICPSYRMAKQIWWVQLKNKLKDLRWIESSNEAELSIILKNRSIIALKGCDSPDSLRGVGLTLAIFDEFQDIPSQAWTEVIRPTLSDKMGKALFCGTPRGVGSWSHQLYTKALTEQDWSAFQYTTIEGGNVPLEEIEAARRDLDEATFNQEYLASFNSYSGTVHYNFSYQQNVKILEEKDVHQIHVGMDFNYDPFTVCIAQIKGQEVHIFDELHIRGSNTEEVVNELKHRYPNSKITIYPDPASRQKKTSAGGKTDFSILVNAGFEVKARPSHTPVRDRVNAVNTKLKNAAGLRTLFVDPKCKFTIDSLQRLTYKEGTNQIDKDSGLDHQADCVGYLIDYIFPIKIVREMEEPQRWTFGTTRKF
jgi:phage terminase large subunit